MNTEVTSPQKPPVKKPKSSWINLVVDFGPLLVFFLAYRHFAPSGDDNPLATVAAVIKGTIAFMVATVIALGLSKWRIGHISPMLWLTTLLVLGFGALTVIFHNPFWIQVKPTAIYLMFAAILFAGLRRRKAMLKILLESAFEGLTDEGWLKLSRNWAYFFVFLAALNEVLRWKYNVANGNFGTWLQLKVWLFTVLSFVFTFSQLPMVLKHGMGEAAKEEVIENPPHD